MRKGVENLSPTSENWAENEREHYLGEGPVMSEGASGDGAARAKDARTGRKILCLKKRKGGKRGNSASTPEPLFGGEGKKDPPGMHERRPRLREATTVLPRKRAGISRREGHG